MDANFRSISYPHYASSSDSFASGSEHPGGTSKQAALWQQLLHHLERDRPYLDLLLMQRHLADKLSISTRTLCRLVTTFTPDNFNTFINRYRVEEACRLMRDPAYGHLSVETLALRAGFNSRGSFYRAFRTIVGTSPSQYRHKKN